LLQIRLLGQFDIRMEGKRVTIHSRAGQSLLAYLVLTPATLHRREKLASLLWPDTSDENARKNLRQELWRIRKAISAQQSSQVEYIQADEFAISFNTDREFWLDVQQLERPLSPEDPLDERLNQLATYQGELLPGFYDEWTMLERQRVRVLFEQKLQQLLERLIAEKRWNAVLEWGEKWIAFGQTPEPAYRALLLAYAALGDSAQMSATYQRCQNALDEFLGVDPSPETRTLYENLLQGKPIEGVDLTSTQVAPFHVHQLNEPPEAGDPPYKGLQYFDEGDAAFYFGREFLVEKLVGQIRAPSSLVVIVGASGSGKSSIVRAGLIPALKHATSLADGSLPSPASDQWQTIILTPTAHPLEALAFSLTKEIESVTAASTLMDDLSRDSRSLALYAKHRLAENNTVHRLLVIDQFEELFTLCRDEFECEAFIDNLLTALSSSQVERLLTIILTIRADFYSHLAQYPELREAVAKGQEYIGPMNADELRRAIVEPAKRANWEFETGLVDLILRDVGDEPGALPLLSHALLETWHRRSGRTMTLKGYLDAGGVKGAIAHTAESLYQDLSPAEQAVARDIFLRLTELGENTEDTRRRAALTELTSQPEKTQQVRTMLNTLAQSRLITISSDTAEVAHEALIREWPRLREWLSLNREDLLFHRHLTDAAHEWELLERDPGALYRGARLAQATEWLVLNPDALNAHEFAFLEASSRQALLDVREREAQRQRELDAAQELASTQQHASRQARKLSYILFGAFTVALVLAGVMLYFANTARANAGIAQQSAFAAEQAHLEADAQQRIATARELAAQADNSLNVDPERSILLALHGIDVTAPDHVVLPEVQNALHRAIATSRILKTFSAHNGGIWTMTFSPDGSYLATGGQDKTLRLWDANTFKNKLTIPAHGADVDSIAYSPDGKQLVTSSDDGTAKLWDADTGQLLFELKGHTDMVTAVVFSPDGKQLATISQDKTIRFWDAASGKELARWNDLMEPGFQLVYTPDGTHVIYADSGSLLVRDIRSGRQLYTINSDQGISLFALSPDGSRLVVVDNLIRVLDAASGQALYNITPPPNRVEFIAFNPSGTQFAVTGRDRKITLWDAQSGVQILTLAGHTDFVFRLAFSPDGRRIASADQAGNVKIWSLEPIQEVLTLSADIGSGPALSPDGTHIATTINDSVQVWDADSGRSVVNRQIQDGGLSVLAFSPDGHEIAAGGTDQKLRILATASGITRLEIPIDENNVRAVVYAPDGKTLAAAGLGGVVYLYDRATGRELLNWDAGLGEISDLAFSPDGKRLGVGTLDSNETRIFEAATGKELLTLTGHTNNPISITFSPDGTRIATGGRDATARIWDATTGKVTLTLNGHTSTIAMVRYSPDGDRLVTASRDGTVRVWESATGKELLTFMVEGSALGALFTRDGNHLVIADYTGIKVLALNVEELVRIANAHLTRSLTAEECQKFLHINACP
jgi:WD40 repeat protein/DNA-binding SARP family transcriptional activator